MQQNIVFNGINITLANTLDNVVINAARYQVRLIQSRAASFVNDTAINENFLSFSLIMAHLTTATNFPFAIPDPLAHPETVGLAWDAYMVQDPLLWDQLLAMVDKTGETAARIESSLATATQEMNAFSVHHSSPFRR
jgi:hypothetical protein